MADPKVLLMDEPSLGLAPVLVQEIFALIERIHEQERRCSSSNRTPGQRSRWPTMLRLGDRSHSHGRDRRETLDNDEVRRIYLGEVAG